jgi:hypothetical protein
MLVSSAAQRRRAAALRWFRLQVKASTSQALQSTTGLGCCYAVFEI